MPNTTHPKTFHPKEKLVVKFYTSTMPWNLAWSSFSTRISSLGQPFTKLKNLRLGL
jgi:hypothetical protein